MINVSKPSEYKHRQYYVISPYTLEALPTSATFHSQEAMHRLVPDLPNELPSYTNQASVLGLHIASHITNTLSCVMFSPIDELGSIHKLLIIVGIRQNIHR